MRTRSLLALTFALIAAAVAGRSMLNFYAFSHALDECVALARRARSGDASRANLARAARLRDDVRDQGLLTVLAVGALLAALAYLLTRWIERPLAQLAAYADRTSQGQLAPVRVEGVLEARQLAESLSSMAARLAAERDQERRFTALVSALSAGGNVATVADVALRTLVADLGAAGGALWVAPERGGALELAATASLDRGALSQAPSALAVEVASTGRAARLDDLGPGASHVIRSALVHVVPRSIYAAPLRAGASVVGVLELAGAPRERGAELDRALEHGALAIQNALATRKVAALQVRIAAANDELRAQNEELRAQEEELRQQSDELLARQRELAERNDALDRASRAKSDFLSSMSHELRTPLNAVIGFADILRDGGYGPLSAEQSAAVRDIAAAGRQLLSLVNDVLDLSRIEAGHVDLELGAVDLDAVISEALSLVAPAAERKRLTVRRPPESPAHRALADHGRARQVLTNLLANAVKFTPDGGAVTVSVRPAPEGVRVEVADTGIGISPADQARLFVPFTQVGTLKAGGTGLGLSISRRLVSLMGGAMGVESEPGRGSTFFFTLPPPDGAPAVTRPATAPPSGLAARARRRAVLIAEDAPSDARVTEGILAREGYAVRAAQSAEAALAELAREVPSLLIVDLGLPGMSGFALIERVRADPRTRSLPVMVLTARDLSDGERRELESRAQLVATKGVMTGPGFLDAVASLTGGARARPSVLVIDDSEVNRRVAAAMLAPAGYEVREAGDAESGLRMARESPPDAILMDVRMPGMDGIEATAALRADPRTRGVPIVAVSAHAMPGDGERCLAAGCDAYLTKPVARHELLRTVEELLAARGQPPLPTR